MMFHFASVVPPAIEISTKFSSFRELRSAAKIKSKQANKIVIHIKTFEVKRLKFMLLIVFF